MSEALRKIEIKKVLGPNQTGTVVMLGDDEKTFVMCIGTNEGLALAREINGEEPTRPFTHDLLGYVLDGFNIEMKQVVISDLINKVFVATLVLEQKVVDENNEWVGKRNEVRIDARPSDCLVLATKLGADIYCTEAVLEKVKDVGELSEELDEKPKDPIQKLWDDIDQLMGEPDEGADLDE
ncbi:MAG: bifunctional nuclease family protein [Planctomycetota bacterium]|jgi:bifunctional DNase/RNase